MKLISRRDRERLLAKGRERRALSTRNKALPGSCGNPVIRQEIPLSTQSSCSAPRTKGPYGF